MPKVKDSRKAATTPHAKNLTKQYKVDIHERVTPVDVEPLPILGVIGGASKQEQRKRRVWDPGVARKMGERGGDDESINGLWLWRWW